MSELPQPPVGVVLAGGLGRRIGGGKAVVQLAGRPLISYPLAALAAVCADVRVVAKPDTVLPPLVGAELWIEPARPRHPLVGIVHALRMAGGRPVLVCAADLPLVTPELLSELARELLDELAGARPAGAPAGAWAGGRADRRVGGPHRAPAVIAALDGASQPLLGCYGSAAATLLAPAAREATASLRAAVAAIGARRVEVGPGSAEQLFNVNSLQDLRRAEVLLSRGGRL